MIKTCRSCLRFQSFKNGNQANSCTMNPDPDEHRHPGSEDLQWGEGIKEKHRDKKAKSTYTALGEQARRMIPGESQCKMFCGGKTCKYCTATVWPPEKMVVKGLYSEWVTDNILAMARMSNKGIEEYKMIEQLLALGIKTVICLQFAGEHAFCGSGNDETGFSYNSQKLMEKGIFYYNFPLPDYGVTVNSSILDIVKVMQFAMSSGKVAVHCHAGLGRTGLLIACYLIYTNRVSASKCIQYVRSRRANSIQTKKQVKTCHEFEEFLKPFFIVFPSKYPGAHEVSINHFLHRQKYLLHGYEARKLKHIPKIVYVCCERLLEICRCAHNLSTIRHLEPEPIPPGLLTAESPQITNISCDAEPQLPKSTLANNQVQTSKQKSKNKTQQFAKVPDRNLEAREIEKITKNLSKKLQAGNANNSLNDSTGELETRSEEDLTDGNMLCGGVKQDDDDSVYLSDEDDDDDDDDSVVLRTQKYKRKPVGGLDDFSVSSMATMPCLSIKDVCYAVLSIDYIEETKNRIEELENKLNKTDEAWKDLASEKDPVVVSALLWEWLDALKEPVLRAQDINILKEFPEKPDFAVRRLERNTRHILEYFALVLSHFQSAGSALYEAVVKRFLAHITHTGPSSSRPGYADDEFRDTDMINFFIELIRLQTDL